MDIKILVPFGTQGLFVAALNNVSSMLPSVPLLTQEKDIPKDLRICHGTCRGREKICRCLNILEVRLNSLVEIQFEQGKNEKVTLSYTEFMRTILKE